MKKLLATLLASTMALTTIGGLVACGGDDTTSGGGKKSTALKPSEFSKVTHLDDPLLDKENANDDKVAACTLKVWAPAEMIPMYTTMADEFASANYHNGKYSNVTVRFQEMEEGSTATELSNDADGGADVFFFTGGSATEMMESNWLMGLRGGIGSYYSAAVAQRDLAGASATVEKDGYYYAFPTTADDGYFLAYSTEDLTAEEAGDLDTILEKAGTSNKAFNYRYGTGFYAATFFFGAGVLPEMKGNKSDFSAYKSAKAEIGAKATINFINSGYTEDGETAKVLDIGDNGATISGILDGTLIGGVCGIWEAAVPAGSESKIGFAKLPMFTQDGQKYQMGAFFGGKYCGVNARTKNGEAALALANYFTNGAAQAKRFELHKSGPSNAALSETDAVKAVPSLAALAAQVDACAAYNANVPQTWWDGWQTWIKTVTAKTTTLDNLALDDLVTALTPIQE